MKTKVLGCNVTEEFKQMIMKYCASCTHTYLPVFNNEVAIRPKHCTGVIELSSVLFGDRPWRTTKSKLLTLLKVTIIMKFQLVNSIHINLHTVITIGTPVYYLSEISEST